MGSLPEVEDDALELIAEVAAGDARQALNHLELAVAVSRSDKAGVIDSDLVSGCSRRWSPSTTRVGGALQPHFRPPQGGAKLHVDASLYWLGRMLAGGADPKFVVRRMLRMASEDIGMADPRVLE